MARKRKSDKKDRMSISFTEYEEDIFDYLEGMKNSSRFIKYLVKEYMNGNVEIHSKTPVPNLKPTIVHSKEDIKKAVEEEIKEITNALTKETDKHKAIEETSKIAKEEITATVVEESEIKEEKPKTKKKTKIEENIKEKTNNNDISQEENERRIKNFRRAQALKL